MKRPGLSVGFRPGATGLADDDMGTLAALGFAMSSGKQLAMPGRLRNREKTVFDRDFQSFDQANCAFEKADACPAYDEVTDAECANHHGPFVMIMNRPCWQSFGLCENLLDKPGESYYNHMGCALNMMYQPSQMFLLSRWHFFRNGRSELMQLRDIRDTMQQYNIITLHIRAGDNLAFSDKATKYRLEDFMDRVRQSFSCAHTVSKALLNRSHDFSFGRPVKIFFATDSSELRAWAKQHHPKTIMMLDDQATHALYNQSIKAATDDGQADQFLMSLGQHFVLDMFGGFHSWGQATKARRVSGLAVSAMLKALQKEHYYGPDCELQISQMGGFSAKRPCNRARTDNHRMRLVPGTEEWVHHMQKWHYLHRDLYTPGQPEEPEDEEEDEEDGSSLEPPPGEEPGQSRQRGDRDRGGPFARPRARRRRKPFPRIPLIR